MRDSGNYPLTPRSWRLTRGPPAHHPRPDLRLHRPRPGRPAPLPAPARWWRPSKRVDAQGIIEGSIPREGAWIMETPQVFDRELLCAAYERVLLDGLLVTDEVSGPSNTWAFPCTSRTIPPPISKSPTPPILIWPRSCCPLARCAETWKTRRRKTWNGLRRKPKSAPNHSSNPQLTH